jgi:hypothetical protein
MNTKDLLPSGSSGSQRIATVALQTTLQEAAVRIASGYFDLVAYLSVTLGFSPKKNIALHARNTPQSAINVHMIKNHS